MQILIDLFISTHLTDRVNLDSFNLSLPKMLFF